MQIIPGDLPDRAGVERPALFARDALGIQSLGDLVVGDPTVAAGLSRTAYQTSTIA